MGDLGCGVPREKNLGNSSAGWPLACSQLPVYAPLWPWPATLPSESRLVSSAPQRAETVGAPRFSLSGILIDWGAQDTRAPDCCFWRPALACDLNQEPASRTPEWRASWVEEAASLVPHRWLVLFALFPLVTTAPRGVTKEIAENRPGWDAGPRGRGRQQTVTEDNALVLGPAPLPRRSWNSRGCFGNSNQSLPTPTLWSSVPLWGGGSAGLDPAAGSAGSSEPWACICVVRKHLGFLKGRKKLAAELFCSRVDERLWDEAVDHHGGPGTAARRRARSQAPRPRFCLWTSLSSARLSDSMGTSTPSFEKEQCLLTASSDDEPAPFVHANA